MIIDDILVVGRLSVPFGASDVSTRHGQGKGRKPPEANGKGGISALYVCVWKFAEDVLYIQSVMWAIQ